LGIIGNLWYRGWTADWSEWMRPMGRLLVLLTTVLVLVMPVTEHLYNWDHFLRGGQDVEFNLLAALLFAAMVVLSMSGRMRQPLVMQPALAATGTSGQLKRPDVLQRRESLHWLASIPLASEGFDGSASTPDFETLTTLRI
jgi:hypothetical protein